MRSLPEILLAIVLLALIGLAAWLFGQGLPVMLPAGLGLSAAAPLVFLLASGRRPIQDRRQHPVMVSVFSGFGCVMTMVGVQRFGEQHQWIAGFALLALAAWVVYQRWFWRRSPKKSD